MQDELAASGKKPLPHQAKKHTCRQGFTIPVCWDSLYPTKGLLLIPQIADHFPRYLHKPLKRKKMDPIICWNPSDYRYFNIYAILFLL